MKHIKPARIPTKLNPKRLDWVYFLFVCQKDSNTIEGQAMAEMLNTHPNKWPQA